MIFLVSTYKNKSFKVGLLSIKAVWKQFYGYGTGFIESFTKVIILNQKPQDAFPELFFKNKMTKIIGLTGGIGSGKTTIANHFLEANIPVYIADDEARKIMQSEEIIDAIRKNFGDTIFDDSVLNREKLSQIVFSDPEKLKH